MLDDSVYIYDIGFGTCEESEYIYLKHYEKFSKNKFRKIILDSTIKILQKISCEDDNNIIVYDYLGENKITFQNILPLLITTLERDYGFEKVETEQSFNCFGWSNLLKEDNWKIYNSNENNYLINKIPQEIKEKIKSLKLKNQILDDSDTDNNDDYL